MVQKLRNSFIKQPCWAAAHCQWDFLGRPFNFISVSEIGEDVEGEYVTKVLCIWQWNSFWQGSSQSRTEQWEGRQHTHTDTQHDRKALIWGASAVLGDAVGLPSQLSVVSCSCLSFFLVWFSVVLSVFVLPSSSAFVHPLFPQTPLFTLPLYHYPTFFFSQHLVCCFHTSCVLFFFVLLLFNFIHPSIHPSIDMLHNGETAVILLLNNPKASVWFSSSVWLWSPCSL